MNPDMPSPDCPQCGAPLAPGTAGGLCPRCLMAAVALPTEPAAKAPGPEIEQVAAAFPQLEVLELIGRGGMGSVFKVRQPKLNRLAALKLLPHSLAEDPAFAGRFEREAQLLARLSHPNIVAVYDYGLAEGFFYLLMEYVDGVNLRQAMRAARFTPEQALGIVPKICEALQFAHDEGILHRDIKPENLLLDGKGRVKLADFGIAKLAAEAEAASSTSAQSGPLLTQAGSSLGTPEYMAPEQRERPAEVDHRADIYSLGVVFYEILTGELPRADAFAPPSAKSAADPRVDAIVRQALESERERRQSSAGEMRTQVEKLGTQVAAPERRATADVLRRGFAWAAILFSIAGSWITRITDFSDQAPPTKIVMVGLLEPWLRESRYMAGTFEEIGGISGGLFPFSSTWFFSQKAMLLAALCWAAWFVMKRRGGKPWDSVLGAGQEIRGGKVLRLYCGAAAFCHWLALGLAGLILWVGPGHDSGIALPLPVSTFSWLALGVAAVWTAARVIARRRSPRSVHAEPPPLQTLPLAVPHAPAPALRSLCLWAAIVCSAAGTWVRRWNDISDSEDGPVIKRTDIGWSEPWLSESHWQLAYDGPFGQEGGGIAPSPQFWLVSQMAMLAAAMLWALWFLMKRRACERLDSSLGATPGGIAPQAVVFLFGGAAAFLHWLSFALAGLTLLAGFNAQGGVILPLSLSATSWAAFVVAAVWTGFRVARRSDKSHEASPFPLGPPSPWPARFVAGLCGIILAVFAWKAWETLDLTKRGPAQANAASNSTPTPLVEPPGVGVNAVTDVRLELIEKTSVVEGENPREVRQVAVLAEKPGYLHFWIYNHDPLTVPLLPEADGKGYRRNLFYSVNAAERPVLNYSVITDNPQPKAAGFVELGLRHVTYDMIASSMRQIADPTGKCLRNLPLDLVHVGPNALLIAVTDDEKMPPPERLYLHIWHPTYYSEPTRLPGIIETLNPRIGYLIEGKDQKVGHLSQRDGRFMADLTYLHSPCQSAYRGPMVLEQPVDPPITFFASMMAPIRMVLSKEHDTSLFLLRQAEEDRKRLEESRKRSQ